MQIKTYNNQMLFVTLDKTETEYLFGEYSEIDYKDPVTRYVLNRLLEIADELYDFKLDSEKTVIEVSKTKTGCVIRFNKVNAKRQITLKQPLNICYCFETAKELLDGLSEVDKNINSILYYYENKYYLFCDSTVDILSEFAKKQKTDAFALKYFGEHGKLICTDAVKKFISVFKGS